MHLKKIITTFSLVVTLNAFGALNFDAMFTPEQKQQFNYGRTLMNLAEGLKAGSIDEEALLKVAAELQIQKAAIAQVQDDTVCSGFLSFMPTASVVGFKIGDSTCDATLYVFGLGGTASIKTKKLLIAAVVAIVLGVAYKKGYLKKIQDYLIQAPDQDDDEQAA